MPTVQEMFLKADDLTKTQRKIFDYMLQHPEAVCYATLKEISLKIGVAEVSILNMCRKLGCGGYVDLKKGFRLYIRDRIEHSYSGSYTLETADAAAYGGEQGALSAMFAREQKCLNSLAMSVGEEQIRSCAKSLMEAREVLIFGHDASKVLADYFAHRLNYLRIKASSFKLGDNGTVQTSLSMADERDVVILFSFPPYYKPISNVARYAAYRGAKVIAITDSETSPAARGCSSYFICNTKTKFFFNTLTAPFSLVSVLTSYIALKMGAALNEILEEELQASCFMNGEFEEEGRED